MKKSFLEEIKSIFHNFKGLSFGNKKKKKNSRQKLLTRTKTRTLKSFNEIRSIC